MTDLADAALPLIRTRADLHRWSAANAHGRRMHEAVDRLAQAVPTDEPAQVYAVTHKALASAIKVVARADDSRASSATPAAGCWTCIPRRPPPRRCRRQGSSTG